MMSSLPNSGAAASVANINHAFEEKEAQDLAAQHGLEYIDLAKFPINPDVLSLLDYEKASALGVVPFYRNGFALKMATVDPQAKGLELLQEQFKSDGFSISLQVCSARGLEHILSLYHSDLVNKKTIELTHEFKESETDTLESQFVGFGALQDTVNQVSAAEGLNAIEVASVQVKASDIHVQPYENKAMLRFRIDGILHDIAELKVERARKLVDHIKYQAGMKSNIGHIPQDGHMSFEANGRQVDLRVSTLPTEWFESVVMRLLDSRKGLKSFSDLGFHSQVETTIGRALRRKSGMVLVTGPTGSGKTTTLYAMLKELNDSERKLVSLEDPVEYHLDGVTQSPVDEQSDYNFANGLKALLRHDPDVILIGEIREATTAKLASEAALTGHVVLSSLHTNSALGAITRLRNLGLESFNIAAALNAVFAQRLVRKVCPHCSKAQWLNMGEHKRAQQYLERLVKTYPELKERVQTKTNHEGVDGLWLQVPQADSCQECSHTGFLGQTVLCETIWFTDELRAAIGAEKTEQQLSKLKTIEQDSIVLFADGLRKVLLGETTLSEVYRVAG